MNREKEVAATITAPELAEAIKAATADVFSTMVNMQLGAGEFHVEQQEASAASGVVSLIGLAGTWVGTGSLSCSAGFACKIASHFLMTEYTAICEDVLDSVAELTNMTVGNVKTTLENRLGPIGLSTPTVIYGRNFQTRSTRNQEWTVVPFTFEGEQMCIQVCITPNPDVKHIVARPGFPIPQLLNL